MKTEIVFLVLVNIRLYTKTQLSRLCFCFLERVRYWLQLNGYLSKRYWALLCRGVWRVRLVGCKKTMVYNEIILQNFKIKTIC